MKTWSLCKIEKDDNLFSFRSDKKEVRNSWCKDYNRELDRLNFFLQKIGKSPVSKIKGYKCI
jgi:hypothetical protein